MLNILVLILIRHSCLQCVLICSLRSPGPRPFRPHAVFGAESGVQGEERHFRRSFEKAVRIGPDMGHVFGPHIHIIIIVIPR